MTDITPELAERMEALVRGIVESAKGADAVHYISLLPETIAEARAIVAELPEPVDRDWRVAEEICREDVFSIHPWPPRTGGKKYAIDTIYEAIKRGRALEREGR